MGIYDLATQLNNRLALCSMPTGVDGLAFIRAMDLVLKVALAADRPSEVAPMDWSDWLRDKGIDPDRLEPGDEIDLPEDAEPVDFQPAPRKNKFGNRRVEIDGFVFDSLAESRRYGELKLMEAARLITDLRVHPPYVVLDAFTDEEGGVQKEIVYEADFDYLEDGKRIVEDVKGGKATQTAAFRIKRKLFLARYPEYELRIVLR